MTSTPGRIFAGQIAPNLFAGAAASPTPLMVFLGGQPGAGKSRAKDVLTAIHADEDLVMIEGDAFRRHHPDYAATLSSDPTRMPDVTAGLAGEWTAMAVEYALTNTHSAIIEGTWRTVTVPQRTAQRAHDLGWRTHAAVVAVPAPISLVATLTRFYDADPALARWTPVTAHDQAVAALPATVQALAESESIDRFTVLDRDGIVHLDEDGADLPGRAGRATDTYTALTTRDLTDRELADMAQDLTRLLPEHHGRTASTPHARDSWARISHLLDDLTPDAPGLAYVKLAIEHPTAARAAQRARDARAPATLTEAIGARAEQLRARQELPPRLQQPPRHHGPDRHR